jgi:hypothetical protein
VNGWTSLNHCVREQILLKINADVCCIQETHLKPDESLENKLIGYKWFGYNRSKLHKKANKGSGGIGMFVKLSLINCYTVNVVDRCIDGILGVKFVDKVTQFSFLIYVCYLPPEDSPYSKQTTDYFGHLISELYLNNDVDVVIFCGDYNARISSMNDIVEEFDKGLPERKVIDNCAAQSYGHGETFVEFLKDARLCLLNGRFCPELDNYTSISHRGLAVVDYIITPHDCFHNFNSFEVMATTKLIDDMHLAHLLNSRCKAPDHSVLKTTFQIYNKTERLSGNQEIVVETLNIKNSLPTDHLFRRYQFDDVHQDFMQNEIWCSTINSLIDHFLEIRLNQDEVDRSYTIVCETVFREMDKYLKYADCSKSTRKRLRNSKPYWNETLTKLWKNMNKAEHAYTKCKGPNLNKRQKRYDFILARKIFDKSLRNAERNYFRKKLSDIEANCTDDPRKFWDHIRKLGPRTNTKVPMKVYDVNGLVSDDINTVLDKWKHEFSSLYNFEPTPNDEFDYEFLSQCKHRKNIREEEMLKEEYECNPDINADFSYDEIEKIVDKLKSNKASGFDCIPNNVLKNKDFKMLLYNMFCKFFNVGILPSVWLKALITPIPKGGNKDPFVPLHYRGISLLSCVCKVYSSILNRRIVNYFEFMNLFSDAQNGFRKGRSCSDHIFTLTSIIRNRQAQNLPTFASFIDMQKAFDWVNRDLLFYKLLLHNIDGKVYKSVKSLYNHPTACIKLNNRLTDWFEVESGVKQGDTLSPTLFSIFINDLAIELENLGFGIPVDTLNVSILMFADDIVLLSESEDNLQFLLNYTKEWCQKWRLKINISKTKAMHFRKKRQTRTMRKFYFGEDTVELVDQYKYLGIVLDQFLDFNVTADVLSGAAGRALGSVISKFQNFRNVHYNTFLKLFHSSVVPVLEYASEVWGFKDFKQCEKVQFRACRYYLGVPPKTPLLAISGDMGWLSATLRRHVNICKLWNRLINMDDSRLNKRVFIWDKNLCTKNWSSEIFEIFRKGNMTDTFQNTCHCDIKVLQNVLFTSLKQEWLQNLPVNYDRNSESKPKLRTYITFKDDFYTEPYVKNCNARFKRSILAQLRSGVLPLFIETGRYYRIKAEDRLCKLCDLNVMEDEFHFICICEKYSFIRQIMYEKVISKIPQFKNFNKKEQFVYLLKCEWKILGDYLNDAWNLRSSLMYYK